MKVETEFVVRLGGNRYINTPNLIAFRGEPLFRVRRGDDGMLGIDFDVFDEHGQRVATFAKSVVVQGDAANYDIDSGHDSYSVTKRSTGEVIAQVRRRGVAGAELDVHVRMYLPNGMLLDAGPDSTNLGGNRFQGNTIVGCAIGINISS